ncbi:DUF2846 domain-containing protein [Permianibacter sp. IMCC34836]|nr:DUF2846 domain-containing protein [Permianibacter fluminis]
MKNIVKLGMVAVIAMMAVGCASVPMATKEVDAASKKFIAPADKANLYIYRNESMGAAIKMPLTVDGQHVGETAANTFVLRQVAPGPHKVQSLTENNASLDITAEAGKNIFVWQEVKMGMMSAGSALHLMSEEEGKKGVLETKQVQGSGN